MKVMKINDAQNMIQLQNGAETFWYKINSSNVACLDLIKTLKVNDEVAVQYTIPNGIRVINELTLVTTSVIEEQKEVIPEEKTDVASNVGVKNNFTQPGKLPEFKCDKCGAALKDDKYKTCYTCSMAERAKGTGMYTKSPEVQDSIKRQAIGHMASRSLVALQGSDAVNMANIEATIERLYAKYQQLVG